MAYKFKKIDDNRWGIYVEGDLLATIGSYEIWHSIKQLLNDYVSNNNK